VSQVCAAAATAAAKSAEIGRKSRFAIVVGVGSRARGSGVGEVAEEEGVQAKLDKLQGI
jgi:hypothetical protein